MLIAFTSLIFGHSFTPDTGFSNSTTLYTTNPAVIGISLLVFRLSTNLLGWWRQLWCWSITFF